MEQKESVGEKMYRVENQQHSVWRVKQRAKRSLGMSVEMKR